MKISTILDKVDENQLFVPAFQREYVWKNDDAKQLIDSLIKEYPTGTMLTWETANPPELKGSHKYDAKQGAVKLLLDGQQRVTTLYMLIRGNIPPYYSAADLLNDTRGLYVNLETLELSYFVRTKMENSPLWQNITHIFQRKIRGRDVVRGLEEKGESVTRDRQDRIDDNTRAIENIVDREFPEQTIPIKASIREAIDIFYKVNSSGVALTEAELALAQISGYWPQARETFKKKLAALEQEGFSFKLDFIVYVLLGCLHNSGSDMHKLHGAENDAALRQTWGLLDRQLLDYVINILRSHAFIDHSDEINSVYALVPIIVHCHHRPETPLSDQEIRKIVKWFYYSQIKSRYISQLPQKLDRDLRILLDTPQPFDQLLQVIAEDSGRLEILPHEFVGRDVRHPLFSLMRWYFKSREAVCFTTGLRLRKNMGPKYQLEKDHIFPYSRLKKAGYGKDDRVAYALAQEFTNRAILTQIANRTKSAASAEDYLVGVSARFPQALEQQSIPLDQSLWKMENYREFLQARRVLLSKQLNKFLEEITSTERAKEEVSLNDLIDEGESEELEFKSSLRWDIKENTVNKKLEEVAMKTVAAFANSQGGTLLVGVDDKGTVLGLQQDYLLAGGNRDKFEIHLRNLLNQQFGTGFVTSRVQIRFHQIEDRDVCQIDTTSAREPVILTIKDKNGQTVEKFYARSGNSSQEIPLSEMNGYLKERFSA